MTTRKAQEAEQGNATDRKQALIEAIRKEALVHAHDADWYRSQNALQLAEYERKQHKTMLEIIGIVREIEHKDVKSMLEYQQYRLYNEYKHLMDENFVHLAELAMIEHMAYGEVSCLLYFPQRKLFRCPDCECED